MEVDIKEQFETDILMGLSLPEKELLSQYCHVPLNPEDYPISCESSILNTSKDQISLYLENEPFQLIELGPTAVVNSKILIDSFLQESFEFTYTMIDSSKSYLDTLSKKFQTEYPQLKYTAIHSDLSQLQNIHFSSTQKNILLFLNSNIGKIPSLHVGAFLKKLRRLLHSGDYLLIGFDLRKNIDHLLELYNAPNSSSQKAYLSILEKINHELSGNFNIQQFSYQAKFNKDIESIQHFLISKEKQTVSIKSLDQSFDFEKDETIYLGAEAKYREQQIITLAENNGFLIEKMFTDENNNFIDSLWKVE
jgi:uncharacterized SAM-dependent methyltransferase